MMNMIKIISQVIPLLNFAVPKDYTLTTNKNEITTPSGDEGGVYSLWDAAD